MMIRKPFGVLPLPNSYWVTPGKLLGGEYPGGDTAEATLRRLREFDLAGVNCFVNLTRPGELPDYSTALPPGTWYFHQPILDHGLPVNHDYMRQILSVVGSALDAGRCVYVHCRMGIGRTGTVLGCQLVHTLRVNIVHRQRSDASQLLVRANRSLNRIGRPQPGRG